MTWKKKLFLLLDIVGIIVLVLFDQYTKNLAVIHLKDKPAFNIISGVLELNYLENKGAAFGMLQNQKIFFIFVAFVILGVIGYVLYKIGNMIDRIRLDYVVDFIYFVLINFPIFNVADIYVSLSTIALVFLLLFYYKENDLSFISFKQKKYRELK